MADLDETNMVKVSTEGMPKCPPCQKSGSLRFSTAAQNFVQKYYRALQTEPIKIASFYAPSDESESNYPGLAFLSITFNGNEFLDPLDFQNSVMTTLSPIRFEIDDFDCQTITSNVDLSGKVIAETPKGIGMTFLVLVSGGVRVGPLKESEMKNFSESFVLVPNQSFSKLKDKGGPTMEWLIQSQTFRYVG